MCEDSLKAAGGTHLRRCLRNTMRCLRTWFADAMPGGFSFAASNTPDVARVANWSWPRGAVYHMRSNFYSVQCLVDTVDTAEKKVHFDLSIGCDQGGPDPAAFPFWFVENVLEECDSPGEYFYDASGQALFYTFNATDKPTGQEEFSLTRTKVIFNVSGTMADPVRNVTIRGLVIRDAAYTFLGTTAAARPPQSLFCASACAARTLNAISSTPGHSIAAARAR